MKVGEKEAGEESDKRGLPAPAGEDESDSPSLTSQRNPVILKNSELTWEPATK